MWDTALVVDAIREKCFASNQVVSQLGAVAFTDQTQTVLPEGLDFTYKVKRWQADARGCCPVLQSRINVDWLTFDPQMFAPLFPRLKEGILRDVFLQKAVVAWDNAPSNRIMVSLLLPGPMEMFFFCSLLLRCDLLAKKVPGRAPYSQHIMIRIWT